MTEMGFFVLGFVVTLGIICVAEAVSYSVQMAK